MFRWLLKTSDPHSFLSFGILSVAKNVLHALSKNATEELLNTFNKVRCRKEPRRCPWRGSIVRWGNTFKVGECIFVPILNNVFTSFLLCKSN